MFSIENGADSQSTLFDIRSYLFQPILAPPVLVESVLLTSWAFHWKSMGLRKRSDERYLAGL